MTVVATKKISLFWFHLVFTLAISSQLINLAGCAHGVEDVSQPPKPVEPPPPTVVAPLNDELKNVLLTNPKLHATLFLDNTTQYNMSISNGVATWQKADLDIAKPYSIKVRFDVELPSNPGVSLSLAQTLETHDFTAQATKTFTASDLDTALFDNDNDTMDNLAEILAGGNPFNPAPTFLTPLQITVLENSIAVLTVQAISPHAGASISYSISSDTEQLFTIDSQTGAISYKVKAAYDSVTPGANVHQLTIQADDGYFTTPQDIAITVTNLFELSVAVGLKQLQFSWSAHPDADYYRIIHNPTGGATFTQLPNSGNIAALIYDYALAVHLFDQANTQFKLQAYKINTVDNSGDILLQESPALKIDATQIVDAIGYFKATQSDSGDNFGRTVV